MNKILKTALCLLPLICIAGPLFSANRANNGVIDLRNHYFRQEKTLKLDGQWEFYWRKILTPDSLKNITFSNKNFIEVPGYWKNSYTSQKIHNTGYATYRLIVLLEKGNYFLKIPPLNSAAVIWINGKKVYRAGTVGDSKDTETPHLTKLYIPVIVNNNSLELVVNNSNFHHARAGWEESIELGRLSMLYKSLFKDIAVDVSIVIISLAIGLFHIITYLFRKKNKNRSLLFFGIIAILFTLRILIIDNSVFHYYFPNMSWVFMKKLEWLITISLNWLGLLFFIMKYPEESIKNLNRFFISAGLLLTIILTFLNTYYMTSLLILLYIFSVVNIGYMIIIISRAYKNKKRDSRLMIFGLIILFITLVLDFYFCSALGHCNDLLRYGFVAVLFAHTINLGLKFQDILHRLNNSNEHLEKMIHLRTRELEESKIQLESKIHQVLLHQEKLQSANNKLLQQINVTQKAKEALQESEKKFRETADLLPEMVYESDYDLNFTYVNQKGSEIFEYSVEEFLHGLNARQLVHPDSMKKLLKNTYSPAYDPSKSFNDYQFVTKSGKIFTGLINGKPIIKNETVVGFRGIVIDITKLRKSDQKIRKLQGFLFNIIDSMPSIMIGVNKSLKITLWNTAAEKNYNKDYKETHYQPLFEICNDLKKYEEKIKSGIKSEKTVSLKLNRYRETQEFHENMTIYPLTSAEGGAVIRIDDITENVRMEELLIQSEKMMSVGGLAAGMAHEINNPLAGMIQNAHVISSRISENKIRKYVQSDTEVEIIQKFMTQRKVDKLLKLIIDSGLRAAEIVENMLSFAKQGRSKTENVNFNNLINETLSLAYNDYNLTKKFDFKKIQVEKNLQEDLPDITCEKSKIQQVILNLIKNASEATHEKTSETGHVPTLILTTKHSEREIIFEIEDNGPGIPESIRNRIFDPFFTTKSVNSGTGLGLSVSYFIITKNHKGKMWVESQIGEGAKFTFTLPLTPENEAHENF